MLSSQTPANDQAISATSCPLCGQHNQCAVAVGEEPSKCWCMSATLNTGAKQQAAKLAGTPRCICAACGSDHPD